MIRPLMCAAVLFLIAAGPSPGRQPTPAAPPLKAGAIPANDTPGTPEAGGLPRYVGAILLESRATAFDGIALPNATLERRGDKVDAHNNDLFLPPAAATVEGRLMRMSDLLPEGRSVLEVLSGYQQGVKHAGGSVLFEGSSGACGGSAVTVARSSGSKTGIIHMLHPYDMISGGWTTCVLHEDRTDQRYTRLDPPRGAGKAAVPVWNGGEVSAGSNGKARVRHTDNRAGGDDDLGFSRRRASAVVSASTNAGVAGARMVPQSVGMAAPLARNGTKEARVTNRRVELVELS